MPYSLGIDLGASFTAVAIADEVGTYAARLSPVFVVPSAVYVSPDGALLTGDAALSAGEGDPSRLVRDFKKRLGDPTPLIVAGTQFTPEQLMAAQLRDLIVDVAEQQGEPAQTIVLTYPVTWGPYRAEHFARVAELSGINVRTFITEAVAAATHLSAQGGVKEEDIVAIVDFGSDAVTATLLRGGADEFAILGTPEDSGHVGSNDFDHAMRMLLDQKLGGAISFLDPADPSDSAVLASIDGTCAAAKETLSMRKEAAISVVLPSGVRRVTVTREDFVRLIHSSVSLAVDTLRRTISSAEIDAEAVTSIVLTGGSSRIPLIGEEFAGMGIPVRTIHHPKLAVALGAAHVARALAEADGLTEDDEPALTSVGIAATSPLDSPARRSLWPPSRRMLIGAVAAALLFIAGLAIALIVPLFTEAGADPGMNEMTVFPVYEAGKTAQGQHWYVSSAGESNNWAVTTMRNGAAEMPGIQLEDTDGAVHAQWSSKEWPSQIYAQLREGTANLEQITAGEGALVFDLTVRSGSVTDFRVSAHCTFPCAASIDIAEVVDAAELGTTSQVIVPAACFADNGLDVAKVNTPFLLIGQGDIALTVQNIRWETELGNHHDAVTC